MLPPEFENYRKKLSVFSPLFLNYAATAPLSRGVIERMQLEVAGMAQPLGQRFYECLNKLEHARREFAELINAKGSEIAFTQNTSTAISTIALALDFVPGDIVLVPDNEFPSNYYPWENLKHKGVVCKTFKPVPNVPLVETLGAMDLQKVKLISISAVNYETGRLYELEDFVSFCKAHQIYSCLDSIQAIGAIPFDVKKIGADFVCSGAQKWIMGPVGCGLIYVTSEHLEKLRVPYVGWTSVLYPEYMNLGKLEFAQEMTRFEPGLPNYLSEVGMAASLAELKEIGWPKIYQAVAANTKYLGDNLRSLGFPLLLGEKDLTAGITSFYVPKEVDHRQVETLYKNENIKITARNDYVRVSPHFFNTKAELDVFLDKTSSIFKKTKHTPQKMPAALPVAKVSAEKKILLLGASGNLGKVMAKKLLAQGFSLHALGEKASEAEFFREEQKVVFEAVDFSKKEQVEAFLAKIRKHGNQQYYALVNCAGTVEASLFQELPYAEVEKMQQVNFSTPAELIHLFLRELKAPEALGVLNIISSTGRCGSPLLAAYSAANGALWSLGESLAREWSDQSLTITSFVAPAMHSPMQKRMGRVALRFFKMSEAFDYDVPENVAEEALNAFFQKKNLHIAKLSRMKIFANAILPEFIDKKISKVWKAKD